MQGEIRDLGTRWVKIWAPWYLLEPSPGVYDWNLVAALDAQVNLARGQNPAIGVVLQSYGFPVWLHDGTALPTPRPNPGETADQFAARDFNFEPQDRMARSVFDAGNRNAFRKPLVFRTPLYDQLGVEGPWGRWVSFLYNRYRHYGCGFVFDLLNEPNNQWWPQQGGGAGDRWNQGPTLAGCFAAKMMQTAQAISSWSGHQALLAAPGTADTESFTSRLRTENIQFVNETQSNLGQLNFTAHSQFVWSHHNYADVEQNTASRMVAVRQRLQAYGWRGWRGERSDVPNMWLTEGGTRLPQVGGNTATQASRIQANWQRLGGYSGDSAGIEMWTQYLVYTDPSYDSGLLGPYGSGVYRPAYGTFRNFPGRA